MSTPQSERAEGRVGDLRESVIDRLESHSELVALLQQVESIHGGYADDYGEEYSGGGGVADVIVSGRRLVRLNRDGRKETPGVAIGVSVITGSSSREGHHERRRLVVQTTLQFREKTLDYYGSSWADDVKDEISAVLTAHKAPWIARGESGGVFEPFWNESVNRYTTDQRFNILSID